MDSGESGNPPIRLHPVKVAQPSTTCFTRLMREHRYRVHLLASKPRGTLHVGVTCDLFRQVNEHRKSAASSFTGRYDVVRLVCHEEHRYVRDAIAREKAIKKWRRDWKIEMIEETNPHWSDLHQPMRTA